MKADFLIRNARLLVTCAGPAPRKGAEQQTIQAVANGSVASEGGRIVFVGPSDRCTREVRLDSNAVAIDAGGQTVLPGFVDPHTHLVYAGDRRDELRRRLAGATYAEISASGGGIVRSVTETRKATEDQLAASACSRLDEMLRCGTTTCEAKSGYGLSTESELKILRVIRRLDREHPIDISATFLGAHEVPLEYRERRADYVRLVIDDMIPAVQREGLAEWCDVFCESGVFSPEESRQILEAGVRAGLKPRIHADELGASGGWQTAVAVGAASADHVLFVDAEGASAMARRGVVATLLPIAAFYLKLGRFAPARLFIESGVPVALATDINPGGGYSPSMPFAMTLACFAMRMTLEEALVGATINAACAIDRQRDVGSLEPGKLMDAVIINGDPIDLVRVGTSTIQSVVKAGRIVVKDGRRIEN